MPPGLRLRVASSPIALQVARLGWRLGLGWLLGRWFVLLGTTAASDTTRRSLVPFFEHRGNILLLAPPDAAWTADVARSRIVQIQAQPGPLGSVIRPIDPSEEDRVLALGMALAPDLARTKTGTWYVARASGDRPPPIEDPDLMFLGLGLCAAAAATTVSALRRLLR